MLSAVDSSRKLILNNLYQQYIAYYKCYNADKTSIIMFTYWLVDIKLNRNESEFKKKKLGKKDSCMQKTLSSRGNITAWRPRSCIVQTPFWTYSVKHYKKDNDRWVNTNVTCTKTAANMWYKNHDFLFEFPKHDLHLVLTES